MIRLPTFLPAAPAKTPPPSFEAHGLNELGVIWLICSDTRSMEWVVSTIGEVAKDPLLNGLDVRALRADASANYARFRVVFPYDEDNPETMHQVLARLRRANNGLDTSYWVPVLISKPSNKGWFFILGIDDSSVAFLKTNEFRLHYAFGRVFFKDHKTKRDVVESSEPANKV